VEQGARQVEGLTVHRGGTYLCMEGPAFSTKAESHVYRAWGMDIIGMTNLQEAKLAREAEMCYATMAMVTDYDCWHPDHDSVTVEMVIQYLNRNLHNAQRIIKNTVRGLQEATASCGCRSALKYAIQTQKDKISPVAIEKLAAIVGKYFTGEGE
jgi:5'-methylthioadenosine phosphorylase